MGQGMAREWTHTEAFAFFGTVLKNTRWSWSGRSPDGQSVAVTLWQDRFEDRGRIYRSWKTDRPGEWRSRLGFAELIENLAHAKNNLGGLVHVVLARAKDSIASPRAIAKCFPHEKLVMRVSLLDEEEGTFVLEIADPRAA